MTTQQFQRILVAIDDSPCSRQALAHARTLAATFNSAVALVTVIPPTSPASYGADPLLGQQPMVVAEINEIQQNASERLLKSLAQEISEIKEVYTFSKIGSVRDQILETAVEWSSDLIIMGTNGRTGLDHFFSGSVAESVIRKSTCPVLVIPLDCE